MSGVTRDIVILGSTGSIGTQGLDIAARNPDRFRVVGLAAGVIAVVRWRRRRYASAVGSSAAEGEPVPAVAGATASTADPNRRSRRA